MPNVRSKNKGAEANVIDHLLTYRSLARDELAAAVGCYHSHPSVRRQETSIRNKVLTIITMHGSTGRP